MLGCIQPMSSPMMKRILGFCVSCACTGANPLQSTAAAVNALSHAYASSLRAIYASVAATGFERSSEFPCCVRQDPLQTKKDMPSPLHALHAAAQPVSGIAQADNEWSNPSTTLRSDKAIEANRAIIC